MADSEMAAGHQSLYDGPSKPCELTIAIKSLHRALKSGGRAFWRSAGMSPWYSEIFRSEGFHVECISVREIGTQTPIDNVNMCVSSNESY